MAIVVGDETLSTPLRIKSIKRSMELYTDFTAARSRVSTRGRGGGSTRGRGGGPTRGRGGGPTRGRGGCSASSRGSFKSVKTLSRPFTPDISDLLGGKYKKIPIMKDI